MNIHKCETCGQVENGICSDGFHIIQRMNKLETDIKAKDEKYKILKDHNDHVYRELNHYKSESTAKDKEIADLKKEHISDMEKFAIVCNDKLEEREREIGSLKGILKGILRGHPVSKNSINALLSKESKE